MSRIVTCFRNDSSVTIHVKCAHAKSVQADRQISEPVVKCLNRLASKLDLPASFTFCFQDDSNNIISHDGQTTGQLFRAARYLVVEDTTFSITRHEYYIEINKLTQRIFVGYPVLVGALTQQLSAEYFPCWYTYDPTNVPNEFKENSKELLNSSFSGGIRLGGYPDPEKFKEFKFKSNNVYFVPDADDEGRYVLLKIQSKKDPEFFSLTNLHSSVQKYIPEPDIFKRRWEAYLSSSSNNAHSKDSTFRLFSWNILAPCYASAAPDKTVFPGCHPEVLEYKFRKPFIMDQILRANADIYCFQECESEVYSDTILPLLNAEGFQGSLSLKRSKANEGVVTCYRSSRWSLVDMKDAYFTDSYMHNRAFEPIRKVIDQKWPPTFVETSIKYLSTVSSFLCLEDRLDSSRLLIVINSHFFWHPLASHIRILQGLAALLEMNKLVEKWSSHYKEIGVCFVGDLNSSESSGCIQLLDKGRLQKTHSCWLDVSRYQKYWIDGTSFCASTEFNNSVNEKDTNTEGLDIEIPFPKMIPTQRTGSGPQDLEYTNCTDQFSDVLDWIFYTEANLKLVKVLPGVPLADTMLECKKAQETHFDCPYNALPTAGFPSDHIPICADLTFNDFNETT